jgi:murein DD-endopeptidase MepM/ murein hydrolase activator NlpD
MLKRRKIVILTDDRITSIECGAHLQAGTLLCILAVVAWAIFAGVGYVTKDPVSPQTSEAAWTASTDRAASEAPKEASENFAVLRAAALQQEVAELSSRLNEMTALAESLSLLRRTLNKEKLKAESESALPEIDDGKAVPVPRLKGGRQTSSAKTASDRYASLHVDRVFGHVHSRVRKRIGNIGQALAYISEDYIPEGSLKELRENGAGAQGGPFVPDDLSTVAGAPERVVAQVGYLADLEERLSDLPIAKPIKRFRVTSPFGRRVDPIHGRRAVHRGIDIDGRPGAPVHSTADGIVLEAGYNGAYGKTVHVRHRNGFSTRYAHLGKVTVKPGDVVAQGKVIGLQGNTGRSTGSHLHYEVHYRNVAINPYNFLKAAHYVF